MQQGVKDHGRVQALLILPGILEQRVNADLLEPQELQDAGLVDVFLSGLLFLLGFFLLGFFLFGLFLLGLFLLGFLLRSGRLLGAGGKNADNHQSSKQNGKQTHAFFHFVSSNTFIRFASEVNYNIHIRRKSVNRFCQTC